MDFRRFIWPFCFNNMYVFSTFCMSLSHMCNVVVLSSLCVWTKLAYMHIMPKIFVSVLQLGKHSLQVKGGQIGNQKEQAPTGHGSE